MASIPHPYFFYFAFITIGFSLLLFGFAIYLWIFRAAAIATGIITSIPLSSLFGELLGIKQLIFLNLILALILSIFFLLFFKFLRFFILFIAGAFLALFIKQTILFGASADNIYTLTNIFYHPSFWDIVIAILGGILFSRLEKLFAIFFTSILGAWLLSFPFSISYSVQIFFIVGIFAQFIFFRKKIKQ
ncbi:MAG: hypothetical protein DRG20_04905 [Deltaproteobacteria bacterium]|nr:MAG: hypothetical protein DRG20_04905 [Deltaproteobacteria bacterium]